MDRRHSTVIGLLLVLGSWCMGCRTEPASEVVQPKADAYVIVQQPQPLVVSVGETREVVVVLEVEGGYHLQANPVPFAYLKPTLLEIDPVDGFELGTVIYPPGKPYQLKGSTDTLSVYDGTIEIRQPVHATSDAQTGEHTFQGTIHYQGCDNRMCFRPTSQAVVFRVDLEL